MKNIWLDGMLGLVVGDALGVPVQFLYREEIRNRKKGPVSGMEGYGTFNLPEGTWSDDSSMALATLDSIIHKGGVHAVDIMENFCQWELEGKYTPFGKAFDQGLTCSSAIYKYVREKDITTCGNDGEDSNGNGSLMRILPVCVFYAMSNDVSDEEIIRNVHIVSGLTHNHLRSRMACGLYYYMVKAIVDRNHDTNLKQILQSGIDNGLKYYGKNPDNLEEMAYFGRLFHLDELEKAEEDIIRSSGYVIDTIEAAVWCLITTNTFRDCLLKAVNLGDDTDTVASIAGGLAGLYYGIDQIPDNWINVIKKKVNIVDMCDSANKLFCFNESNLISKNNESKVLKSLYTNVDWNATFKKLQNEYNSKIYDEARERISQIENEPSVVNCFMKMAKFSYLEDIVNSNFSCRKLTTYNKDAIKRLCKERGIVNWFTVNDIRKENERYKLTYYAPIVSKLPDEDMGIRLLVFETEYRPDKESKCGLYLMASNVLFDYEYIELSYKEAITFRENFINREILRNENQIIEEEQKEVLLKKILAAIQKSNIQLYYKGKFSKRKFSNEMKKIEDYVNTLNSFMHIDYQSLEPSGNIKGKSKNIYESKKLVCNFKQTDICKVKIKKYGKYYNEFWIAYDNILIVLQESYSESDRNYKFLECYINDKKVQDL